MGKLKKRPKDLNFNSLIKWILPELAAVSVVVSSLSIELAHIARTSWVNLFLYDSDSLTLPILRQSLALKEPILWVFSSQLNLFPEGIFYVLASIFTTSVRASLVLNAAINVLLFYVLIRVIIKLVSNSTRTRQTLFSVMLTLLLIIYMLLETQSPVISQTFATYFLFTTYYYGVIIIGLLEICVVIKQLKTASILKTRNSILLAVASIIITGLTVASNPLYLLQIIVPILAALLVLVIFKSLKLRKFIIISAIQIGGFILGMIMRLFLTKFIGQSLSVHTAGAVSHFYATVAGSIFFFAADFTPKMEAGSVRIRVLLNLLVLFFSIFFVLFALNKKLKTGKFKKNLPTMFVVIFAALQPILLAIGLGFLNDVQQRYLIAPIILPILGLIALVDTKVSIKAKKVFMILSVSFCLLAFIFGLVVIPATKSILSPASYPGEACLESALDYKPADGVGDYWISRSLDVYNSSGERVLQLKSGLEAFPWLDNLGSYENKKFTFLVLFNNNELLDQRFQVNSLNQSLSPTAYNSIGTPSKINTCPGFSVFQYYPGTKGYEILNKDVDSSANAEIKARQTGDIEKFTKD